MPNNFTIALEAAYIIIFKLALFAAVTVFAMTMMDNGD